MKNTIFVFDEIVFDEIAFFKCVSDMHQCGGEDNNAKMTSTFCLDPLPSLFDALHQAEKEFYAKCEIAKEIKLNASNMVI